MEEKRIEQVLAQLGIPCTRRRYYYLTAVLEELLQNGIEIYIHNFRSRLYPKIAKPRNVSISAISRAMEVMSELAFKEHSDLFCEIFGNDLDCPPTVTDFLVKLTRYIQKLS